MVGSKQTDGVYAVSDTAKGECEFDAEFIDKGSAEESKDCECGIEGRVLEIESAIIVLYNTR